MNGILRFFIVMVLIGFILAGAAFWSGYSFLHTRASTSSETTTFEVRPGESFKLIAKHLEDQQLVRNARFLELYARFSGRGSKVKVGEYSIRKDSTPQELFAVISSGKSIEYSITIQEGFNIFEIADVVEKNKIATRDEFLQLVRNPKIAHELLGQSYASLEGYLFPETYFVTKFTGPMGLIRMMVARFKENYEKAVAGTESKLSKHELVTLASIIEKETGAPEERPIIASVFYNRMKLGMKLQTDPTVIYGIWEKTGEWNGNISRADLQTPSRYNTYSFTGLPIGPIANPGLEALQAAAHPGESDYLFFVSRNNGTHVFSKDLKGHLKAISSFQLDPKAREGKSWRDLKDRPKASTAK